MGDQSLESRETPAETRARLLAMDRQVAADHAGVGVHHLADGTPIVSSSAAVCESELEYAGLSETDLPHLRVREVDPNHDPADSLDDPWDEFVAQVWRRQLETLPDGEEQK